MTRRDAVVRTSCDRSTAGEPDSAAPPALVAEGANREIADRLRLSVGTVKARITRILAKLDLRSRTQLAVWATRGRIRSREVS